MRCFVAVEVPPAVRAAAAAAAARLARRAPRADVRWTAPETIHLTLKFLGAVDDARVPEVCEALAAVARVHAPLSLSVGGIGAFPSVGRPRVIHAAVGGEGVASLAAAVDEAVVRFGVPAETQPFRGHLTIGRVRSPRALATLAAALRAEGDEPLGARWRAREMVIFRSLLRPTGAVHEPVARLALGG